MRIWREGVKVDLPASDEVPSFPVIGIIKRAVEIRFPIMGFYCFSQALIFLVLFMPFLQKSLHFGIELLKRSSCEAMIASHLVAL